MVKIRAVVRGRGIFMRKFHSNAFGFQCQRTFNQVITILKTVDFLKAVAEDSTRGSGKMARDDR